MEGIVPGIRRLYWLVIDQARRNAEYFERRRLAFCIFAAVSFPLYYYIWHDLFPQPYENLPLRLIGSLACTLLIFYKWWPQKLRKYMPIYWYLILLYGLPFFFLFMFLMNGGSAVWTESTLVAIFMMVLLLDWVSMIVHSIIGFTLACLAYYLMADLPSFDFSLLAHTPVILFALVFGTISNYATEAVRLEQEKTMLATAGSIAHELRTPLLGVQSGAAGLRKYLPALISTYRLARENNLDVPPIRAVHLDAMDGVLERIESEANYSNAIIDILIASVRLDPKAEHLSEECSLNRCIEEALERYPFTPGEKNLVHWTKGQDLYFRGSELLMVHVLFNLLKNALRQIETAGKGEITLRTQLLEKGGKLFFRDTGSGIPPDVLPHIFKRFYSSRSVGESLLGSGIGLAFCQDVLQAFGGKIECFSESGQYTEFVLTFPE
ncbi:MAG: CAI-1 autoinducer sensor kinase/phosphatase CqsS [Betaproteobacteria bacterium ADurb.Bin341]|nr:MAG: CAI-1 autoinducer sensor kinase/phosphatase CqsS [Betaproteobacteria bacterium ADurb.Bin341]